MSVSFADLRAMLAERRAPQWDHEQTFTTILSGLQQNGVVLTQAEQDALRQWARVQKKAWPMLKHPRVVLFASAYEGQQAATQKTVSQLASGDHMLTALCALADADLRVYELDTENPATNLGETPAAHAISYGLMAVDDKTDMLIVSSISMGAEKIIAQLANEHDPLNALAQIGGHDLCALTGAVLAAHMAQIPVICPKDHYPWLSQLLTVLLPDSPHNLLPCHASWQGAAGAVQQLLTLKIALTAGPQATAKLTKIADAA